MGTANLKLGGVISDGLASDSGGDKVYRTPSRFMQSCNQGWLAGLYMLRLECRLNFEQTEKCVFLIQWVYEKVE